MEHEHEASRRCEMGRNGCSAYRLWSDWTEYCAVERLGLRYRYRTVVSCWRYVERQGNYGGTRRGIHRTGCGLSKFIVRALWATTGLWREGVNFGKIDSGLL